MGDLKLLLLIVLPAFVLGCIIGIAAGKYKVKKASGQLRSLLSPKERILYSVSIAVGVICLLVGFLYQPASEDPYTDDMMQGDMGMMEGGMMEGGMMEGGMIEGDMGMMEGEVFFEEGAALEEGQMPPEGEDGVEEELQDDDIVDGQDLTGDDDIVDGQDLTGDEDAVAEDLPAEATTGSSGGGGATARAVPGTAVRIGGGSGGSVVIVR